MKIAFLGPFTNSYLRPYIPDLTEDDVRRAPGMGGFGLVHLVLERMKKNLPTALITLDTHLENSTPIHRSSGNCEVFILPRRKRQMVRSMFDREQAHIRQALEQANPDIIHVNWTYEYALAALKLQSKVPVLVTVRDHALDVLKYEGFHYLPNFLLTLWVLRNARYLSVVSPHLYDFVSFVSTRRVWLVQNAVGEELGSEPQRSLKRHEDGCYHILTTTIWNKLKNPEAAIRGFQNLRRQRNDLVLHLCGKGMEQGGPCEVWTRRNGLLDGVVFEGQIAHEDLLQLMRISYAYLHTSRTEACNTAIAEAMSLGLPVIGGRRSGGVPWQLDFGHAGILVDINNAASIACALRYLLDDGDLWLNLSQKSRERARYLYDNSRIGVKYDLIYDFMAHGGGWNL